MNSQPASFGETLRRLRQERGVSQADLARRVNYTKSYLSKVESGAKPPTPDLARLCDEALDGQGRLTAMVTQRPRGRVRPAELPAPVAAFVGRSQQLAALDAAGPITVITGPAGGGKTALAVQWAHGAVDRYPDGALFIDLRGHGLGRPMPPEDALDAFLRSLGVAPDRIPPQRSGRSALLRSLLAERQMLLLLDNAADSAQVRPLLPGAGPSAVIVTSRNRLSGMVARDGASIVSLPLLSEAEAIMLLEHTIGSHRVEAEPSAAVTLAHQCARLPLAIRIAAERATARRTTLAELTQQLSAGRERLDLLAADDDETGIRAILSWSYQALPDLAARAFRLLGLHPGPECGIGALAALLGGGPAARMAASSLVDAHLVEETVDGRLRLHDLLYAYAADRAAEDEPAPMRTESWNRLVAWYLYSAFAAENAIVPGRPAPPGAPPDGCEPMSFGSYDEAYAWCEAERANLISLVHRIEPGLAWRMAAALSAYFLHTKRWSDWISTHEAGLRAAESVGDESGQARMLSSLGAAYVDQHRWAEALDHLGRALVLRQRMGERVYQGYINNNMAQALGELGRHEESLAAYRQAIAIFLEVGERYGLGSAYNNLGCALTDLGRYADAEPALHESLRIHREGGYRYGEGMALDSLGTLYRKTGRTEVALDYLQRAFALRTEIDDRHGMAMTQAALGDLHAAAGDEDAARLRWRTALEIFEAVGAPQAADMRAKLGQEP